MTRPYFNRLGIASISALAVSVFYFAVTISCGPPEHSRAAQAMRGKALFEKHCVDCHGQGGDEPNQGNLEVKPADLTKITSSRGLAEFPIAEVARIIDGRKMLKGHGAEEREMPVWGDVFAQEEGLDDTEIKGKMAEIIAYLMTIQEAE